MQKTCLIFDYFKEAFHVNKNNKKLYLPQIALIAFSALFIITVGLKVYSIVGNSEIYTYNSEEVFSLLISNGIKALILLLFYGIISVIIESGLFNMYKEAVLSNGVSKGTFWEGVKKYSLKFLIGKLIVLLCWLIILPFYLVIGLLSLLIGLFLIPFIIGVFLTMWKVSLVMNDSGIITAFKDSFRFAKNNFIPLSILQIINWAFTKGSSSSNYNQFNYSNTYEVGELSPDFVARFTRIAIATLIPFVTIATVVTSLIKMIFEVFFSLVLFVTYKNGFKHEEIVEREVTS